LEIRHLACKNLLSDIESKKCDSNEPNTLKQNTSIINKDNIQKDPNSIVSLFILNEFNSKILFYFPNRI
jgi:hypothetical protein